MPPSRSPQARRLRISARLFGPSARLLSAQLAIGAAAIFARYALLGAGPLAVSALRLTIAAILAALVVLVARRNGPIGPRRELALAFAAPACHKADPAEKMVEMMEDLGNAAAVVAK